MIHQPLGVQMYTVRDAAAQSLATALKQVAALGYSIVELAGLFDMTATEVSQTLAELGLKCISAHVPLEDLTNNLAEVIKTYQIIGTDFLVCPWLDPEQRKNEADYHTLAATLNDIGGQCRREGLQLCYHHHDFELVKFKEKYALDILLEESDPDNLKLEVDTYWLQAGGENPAAYIRRWAKRIPIIHLKDMTASKPVTFAPVGSGILEWSDILKAAQTSEVQWYVVEQDTYAGDPFESLELSFTNLNKLMAPSG